MNLTVLISIIISLSITLFTLLISSAQWETSGDSHSGLYDSCTKDECSRIDCTSKGILSCPIWWCRIAMKLAIIFIFLSALTIDKGLLSIVLLGIGILCTLTSILIYSFGVHSKKKYYGYSFYLAISCICIMTVLFIFMSKRYKNENNVYMM